MAGTGKGLPEIVLAKGSRVATVREKVLENEKFSSSGNYIFSQGNLRKM